MSHTILFKVAAVSSNTNSFGLRGHVLVSRTGLAVQVGLNRLNERKVGETVRVPLPDLTKFRKLGCRWKTHRAEALVSAVARKLGGEIPRALLKAPRDLVREVFSKN